MWIFSVKPTGNRERNKTASTTPAQSECIKCWGGGGDVMIKAPWLDGEQWRMFPAISGTLGPAWRTSTEIHPLREIRKKNLCCCGWESEGYVYSTVTGTTSAVKTLGLAIWLTVTVRQGYSYAAVIMTTVSEQNDETEIIRSLSKNGHTSVQSKQRRIGCGFHTFTEGYGDTDGVCHDWNVCRCQGSDHKPLNGL